MGIQINGQTDTITAIDGQMTISGTDLSTDSISLSTINATGVSTFAGNIDANGDLDVDGHTELDAVNVSGFLTATSAYYSGDVTVLGTLTYEDVTNVDVVGIATARAGLRINGGGLYVTGVSTFNGDLSITDKIVHEGDTDTAIRFPVNDTITAETGGSERLRINSSGNIGIGTDDPDGKLNIYSTNPTRVVIEGDGSSTASAALVLKSNDETSNYRATGVFYYDTLSQTEWFSGRPYTGSDTFAIHRKTNLGGSTGNTTAHPDNTLFLINSSGNIGIGSHNPGVILDVREKKTAGSTQIRLYNTDNSNTTTQTAEVSLTPDSRALAGAGIKAFKENADFSTNANRDISLALNVVQNNSQTEAVRITSSGNTGIGTDNPVTKLQVVGTSRFDLGSITTEGPFYINGNKAVSNGAIVHVRNDGVDGTHDVFGGIKFSSSPGYDFVLGKNSRYGTGYFQIRNQADTPLLTIGGTGNVGIGTDNPESLLHIKGTTGQLIVEDTNGASTIIMKNVGTNSSDDGLGSFTFTNTGYSGVSGIAARTASNGSGAILQFLSGASAEAMRLDGSGRLLVGGTTAQSVLGGTTVSVQSAGSAEFNVLSGASSYGAIYFGDGTTGSDRYRGYLEYNHSNDNILLGTAGAQRFRVNENGAIGIAGANYGSSGQVLTSQGSGSAPQWATLSTDAQSVAILTDVKTQGTTGGTFTSGAWQVRDLNTEAYDPDGIVTLSSNQFTLVSGTYYVWWFAPGYTVTRHQSRLWNVNGNNQEELGDSVYTPSSVQVPSQGAAIVSNGTYRIEHRCQTTQSGNGFGVEANFTTERYTRVVIIKIG